MYKKYIKRIFDIIISIFSIIVLLPLFLVFSIIIKLIDGRVLYKQVRTGRSGKNFVIYKFCTMRNEEITRFGSFLRKFGLDELPQLFNILKGDMSLIGPRPWITSYYKNMNNNQKRRVEVRPGLVGLAQLKGNNIDVFKKIDYDLEYIDSLSFVLDLKIIIKTAIIIFGNKHTEIKDFEIKNEINELVKYKKNIKIVK